MACAGLARKEARDFGSVSAVCTFHLAPSRACEKNGEEDGRHFPAGSLRAAVGSVPGPGPGNALSVAGGARRACAFVEVSSRTWDPTDLLAS